MTNNSQNYDSISMVDRAIQIINEIYKSEVPIGVSEISSNLDLPKATVYRILNTLFQNSIIEKDKNGKYGLGLIFIQYSEKVKSKVDLNLIAKPFMVDLSAKTGESTNLGILDEDNVVTISSVNGESSVLVSRLIPVSPLHCSSMGKIFLSYQDDEMIKAYFKRHNQKRTVNTISNYEDFLLERKKIIAEQISYDIEEYEYGLGCISAPIYNSKGKIAAGISVSGPISRMRFKGIKYIENELKNVANKISEKVKVLGINITY
ncbi:MULTISPECIES: IclR family transcriptional regulator [Clostridium]|uniref:Pectin degradation repressor protein KdgR n=2 Tax=Clostridium TaxID=1485 RepID=D8GPA8_CLOLD|nr:MULTISPECIES: IclR family transcriptional regulator [Clostridium]ADK15986.1 predicted transcriptional regulator, IclR family [Clostridium ljungdahlii DSM 13528]OAA87139.1 Pectin degradation repressor protein KdgR [Clostridium ljungdahlii DSM 13528]OAA93774.1 Pectin degradation repressor protein KdgR [Clostridium coskatii]OBR96064.1 pectin degradation repressor protein KdgR [Clostridium coskatii]